MSLARQKALLETTKALIAGGNDLIAKLDPGLTAEARRDRVAAIRETTLGLIAATRDEANALRAVSRESISRWSQAAARRRAKFNDDAATDAQQRLATIETLKRTSTFELLDHLADAIHDKSLAKAEAVRLEYQSRSDRNEVSNARFTAMFDNVKDEHALAVETEHKQIDGLGEFAEVLIHEFARGQSNPLARISSARRAGLALTQDEAA